MLEKETQQHPDQGGAEHQERQRSKSTRTSSTLLKDLRECLLAFQTIDVCGKIIVGILVTLIIGGIIFLLVLVAILPNASTGIGALLTVIGGFLAGRVSKQDEVE